VFDAFFKNGDWFSLYLSMTECIFGPLGNGWGSISTAPFKAMPSVKDEESARRLM